MRKKGTRLLSLLLVLSMALSLTACGGGSKFKDVTLDAQGVVTGGGTDWYSINYHGQQPSSVTQNEDGSIVLTYSEFEKYTIYPVGVIPEMYTSYLGNDLDQNAVHLEYFLTDGGVMNILYHADPASLGTTQPWRQLCCGGVIRVDHGYSYSFPYRCPQGESRHSCDGPLI